MIKAAPRYTAAQVILLAADDLMAQGGSEFSEWDLSIAAWVRDRNRFGMRGHAQTHPDHKRVMMEIMGKKPQNPLLLGLMEKVRPNFYRLTPLGRAEAQRMRMGEERGPKSKPTPFDHYELIADHLAHPAFRRWQEDPEEPKRWADAADFLGAKTSDQEDAAKRLQRLADVLQSVVTWCNQKNLEHLPKGPSKLYPPIHIRDVSELHAFLQALLHRFPQLEAPRKHKLPPKG
jgi:hypothetical protein